MLALATLALVLPILPILLNDPASGATSTLLTPQGAPPVGFAGADVAVAGDLMVVGAPHSNTFAGSSQVYVYRRPAPGLPFAPVATLVPDNAFPGRKFGGSVAIDPVTRLIAVGAYFDTDKGLDAGAVYLFRENSAGFWLQEKKLHAMDTNGGDRFGWDIDIQNAGPTSTNLIVAAPYKNEGGSGAAYVFTIPQSGLTQQTRLTPQSQPQGDRFGYSVAIDNWRAAVGTIPVGATASGSGGVHMFYAGPSWFQTNRLVPVDTGSMNSAFGGSVSMSSDRLVIGAPRHSGAATEAGAAYVFSRSGTAWNEVQRYLGTTPFGGFGFSADLSGTPGALHLAVTARNSEELHWTDSDGTTWPSLAIVTAPDGATSNTFGNAVSWDGSALACGAQSDDEAAASGGATYLFDTTSSTWTWTKVLPTHAGHNEEFGSALAVDGDVAVIGAREDDDLTHEGGAAYVWERHAGTWTQTAKLDAGSLSVPYALLGSSVAVHGDTVVAGAPSEGLHNGPTADGAAYVFRKGTTSWSLEIRIDNVSSNARMGAAVAVGDDLLMVGAPGSDSVYSLTRQGTTWSFGPGLVGASSGDDFGAALALHEDVLVVGAPRLDFYGPNAGGVYVYRRTGSAWAYQTTLSPLTPQAGEQFGSVVALDGERIVVSAPSNDSSGTDAGAVYTFRALGATWAFESAILPSGFGANYQFGTSLALQGNALAIGNRYDAAQSVNGGAAYVYRFTGFLWTRDLALPDTGLQPFDARGTSCAWSGSNQLMVGLPGRDADFPDCGAVELWDLALPDTLYCAGKTHSMGCVPFMSLSGRASVSSAAPFDLGGWNLIPNEPGFLLYGFAKQNLAFHGGTLCVKLPFRRLFPIKQAQPFGPPPCTGVLQRNFNNRIQSGVDPLLTVGQRVFAQWRLRDPADPAGFGDGFTDAVRFEICP